MKIAIITPVYKAWGMVQKMCDQLDANTSLEFVHVLCADSCDVPPELIQETLRPNRFWLKFDDGESPEKHRPCITKATQTAFDFLETQKIEFDYLFYVETDLMLPPDWDKHLIFLSHALPENWMTLDVYPVNDKNEMEYPANLNKVRGQVNLMGSNFEVIQYGDWNATLFNPKLLNGLRAHVWRFDDVPSHHDILLSRNFREKMGYEREDWIPPTFFRTQEVRAIHYPNSSRTQLPEGLKTPSNPR